MDIQQSFEKLYDKIQLWFDSLIIMLPNFILAIILVLAFALLAKLIKKLSHKLLVQFSHNVAINRLVSSLIYSLVILIGLFVALGVMKWDKTVTSLLAGAGIIGLALSLAFQDTFTNFISGVVIATRKPFKIGDVVKTNEHYGIISKIDMRAITIYTPPGQSVIIPNKLVLQNPIENYSEFGVRRVDLEVGVSYSEDLKKVKEISIGAIQKITYLLPDKEVELFYTEFDDHSVNLVVRYWIKFQREKHYKAAMSDGIMNIMAAYKANNITIPFPIRTLDFGIKGGQKLNEVLPSIEKGYHSSK